MSEPAMTRLPSSTFRGFCQFMSTSSHQRIRGWLKINLLRHTDLLRAISSSYLFAVKKVLLEILVDWKKVLVTKVIPIAGKLFFRVNLSITAALFGIAIFLGSEKHSGTTRALSVSCLCSSLKFYYSFGDLQRSRDFHSDTFLQQIDVAGL